MFDTLLTKFTGLFGKNSDSVGSLIRGSFRLLGEENVQALLVARLIFSLVTHLVFIAAIAMITFNFHSGWGSFLLVVLLLFVYPYSFFYHIRARARQTWFAYAKITNHADPLHEAQQMIRKQKWTLRLFALVELCLKNASSNASGERSGGIMQVLVGAVLAALQGAYEVAEAYLLPATVIERSSLADAAKKLQQLKDHVPQTLLGTFGYDFFGSIASSLLAIIYAAILVIGAGLGWGLPHFGMVSPAYMTTFNSDSGDIQLFLFPVLSALALVSLLRRWIKIGISSLQATYFAIFYTRINRPDELSPEEREKVDSYLLLPAPTA